MASYKRGVAGFFADEEKLKEAAAKVRDSGYKAFDAISPFPIHGLDEACGLKRSWIPWVCFVFGSTGLFLGWFFQYYVSVMDWPIIIGGKPNHSLPAFVPVMFELTILFGALSSVAACLVVACRLPKVNPPVIDPDLTCCKFAIFIPEDDVGYSKDKVKSLFESIGANEVKEAEF